MRILFPAALAAMTIVASCSAPPPPRPAQPTPLPTRAPPPTPAPAADWRDWPLTPGTWVYRQDDRGTIALFGASGADALLTLRCDRSARMMYLSVAAGADVPTSAAIRTTSQSRQLAVQPTGGSAYVAASFAPSDGLLDAIAFSRGRFIVDRGGAAALVVPVYAEVGRVIEDCRG